MSNLKLRKGADGSLEISIYSKDRESYFFLIDSYLDGWCHDAAK